MIARQPMPLFPDDTAGSVFERMSGAGHELLLASLDRMASGDLSAEPQDDSLATYARKIDKNEAHINWSEPATAIDRRVRAFHPDPVACGFLAPDAMRVRIHRRTPRRRQHRRAG